MRRLTVQRKFLNRIGRSAAGLHIASWQHRAAFRIALGRRRCRVSDGSAVIIATAGDGNIGDQAMLDAATLARSGRAIAVVDHLDNFNAPAGEADMVAIPNLVSGYGVGAFRPALRLAKHLRSGAELWIVGADIMDGAYSRREAYLRASLLRTAARHGLTSRVLGFSWSAHPDPISSRMLVSASSYGELCVRDPESARRMERQGFSGLTEVADVAFTLTLEDPVPGISDWLDDMTAAGKSVVIVNASGLIAQRHGLAEEYVTIIDDLLRDGAAVLLLPHVIRDSDSDLQACGAAYETFAGNSEVQLIRTLLSPAQVRWLCARSGAVLTGRMHLSILSLSVFTPAAVFTTQSKVEGLFARVGLSAHVISPGAGMAIQAVESVRQLLALDQSDRSKLREAVTAVRRDAGRNFD